MNQQNNMKKFLTLCLTLITSLSWCQNKIDNIKITDGKGLEGLVKIGDKKRAVISVLGKPKRITKYTEVYNTETRGIIRKTDWEALTRTKHFFRYDKLGITLFFQKNKVVKIVFRKDEYSTLRGIKIGDKSDLVYQTYGKNNVDFLKDNTLRVLSEGIDFLIQCNLITEIRIYEPIILK